MTTVKLRARICIVSVLALAAVTAGVVAYALNFRRPPAVRDIYRFTVYSGDSELLVPWELGDVRNMRTGEKYTSGAALAMTRTRDYNIPAGDLPSVLHQILAPATIPVFRNEHFHKLITWSADGKGRNSLVDELKADMRGLHVDSIVGRYTVADAVRRALEGTGCKYEVLGDTALYVFCRNHLELDLDAEAKSATES